MTTLSPTLTNETASTAPLRALLRRPAVRLVLAALAAGLLSAGAASPASAAAETCPNATLREQNSSTELPECRAYEMVSSPYKQGFDLTPNTFSDDGLVNYYSTGSFAGNGQGNINNEYLGVRTPEGWETRSLEPPSAQYFTEVEDLPIFAADLRSSVWDFTPNNDPAGEGNGLYVRDFDGNFTRVGRGVAVLLASDDLSHLVVGLGLGSWEYAGAGEAAVLRQENVDNNGGTLPGAPSTSAISRDGRVLVLSTGSTALWARIGDSATVAVSGSECMRGPLDPGGACNGPSSASYAGEAQNGSRVFFTTAQQLVNGDTDSTPDLYACDIPPGTPVPVGAANACASLTEVSGAVNGANVESLVKVSEDGSHVYFMAEGAVLAGNPGANDETAVAGNHNLYLWTKDAAHPAGTTTFVARLDSNDLGGAQTTSDGRYLLFTTSSSLVNSGPGQDTDGRADMYRYDAESQTMQRISTSVTGSAGNDPGFDAAIRRLVQGRSTNSISADGSRVVFATGEALSPQDTDGISDVYLWHDGRVSLISHGGGELPWIDASGQDIYFVTEKPLSAADRDVNVDIYDARVDGGFDLSSSAPCSGDACQGQPSTPPAPADAPGSQTLQGAGNPPLAAVVEKATTKPLTRRQKLAKALKQCRKKPKHRRVACERQARKRYAPVKTSARRSHR
jgi:ribosomal protein L39E